MAKLPLFGYFYKRTNILVNRKSIRSRAEAFTKGAEKLEQGIGLCIYPEGGVPDDDVLLARFKDGAFRLAVNYGIPIIPVSYPDNKKHFPYSIWQGGYPGRLRAIVHQPIVAKENSEAELSRLKKHTYNTIFESLKENGRADASFTQSENLITQST